MALCVNQIQMDADFLSQFTALTLAEQVCEDSFCLLRVVQVEIVISEVAVSFVDVGMDGDGFLKLALGLVVVTLVDQEISKKIMAIAVVGFQFEKATDLIKGLTTETQMSQ